MSRRVIERAAALIADPANWTQGAMARSKNGHPCLPARGAKFDPFGAAYKVTGANPNKEGVPLGLGSAIAAMNLAATKLHGVSMPIVNDTMTHADVMNVMRQAWMNLGPIEREEADAA